MPRKWESIILGVLDDGEPHYTSDLIEQCSVPTKNALYSQIKRLRAAGYTIHSETVYWIEKDSE